MTLVGDGVSVMAVRFPARSHPGAMKMSGNVHSTTVVNSPKMETQKC